MIDYSTILIVAARSNFWAFCVYYDAEFFKKRKFLHKVAEAFQQIIDNYKAGKSISVMVSMPPRAGKSYITSLFAAYWLGTFPELSVMRNTCTSRLYQKFSYDTRAIIRNKKYTDVFPYIELADDKQNLDGWNLKTSKQVAYFGAGVGGTIIGFGANLAISDDLYKDMKDALSEVTVENVEMWKESAHNSRMEKNCPEIFIGTRWSTLDILGKAEVNISVIIPAIITNDGVEKSFCDDVKTLEEYIKIRENIEPSIWWAEYMQDPKEQKGLLIPENKLNRFEASELDGLPIKSLCFVDPANTGGDNFAAIFIGILFDGSQINVYVHDVIHNTAGLEANSIRTVEKMKLYKCENVTVEVNGLGVAAKLAIMRDMNENAGLIPLNSREPKEVRIISNYEFILKHFYFINSPDNHEYVAFVSNLTNYVYGANNLHRQDAIDVCSMAANYLKVVYSDLIYS